MSQKLKIIALIENENGDSIIQKASEKVIPDVEEFDKQGFRISLDQLEKAFLTGRKEVCVGAVSEYLEIISKKKTYQEFIKTDETVMMESPRTYGLDMEIGGFDAKTHVILDKNGKTVYSVAKDYFEPKNPMERFQSPCKSELALKLTSKLSYNDSTEMLKRICHEDEGIKTTTLRNIVENQGKAINAIQHNIAEEALAANGFTVSGDKKPDTEITTAERKTIDKEIVKAAAAELELENIDAADYEEPTQTVNISADDVMVDRQASKRPNSPEKGQKKRVSNTVIHIQQDKRTYILNNGGIKGALKLLLGFLFANSLTGLYQFVFFTDGATDLNDPIKAMFGFLPIKIILDWYHLMEKVKQRLSQGMKGYKKRNAFLDLLSPVLWRGDVAGAIAMLEGLSDDLVKSRAEVVKLIDYLKRNQIYIPCYIMRAKLGLWNSSNRVENANGRVVSFRQKSQGMSWSREGSSGLASVSAAIINGEILNWTGSRTLHFNLLNHSNEDITEENAAA